MVSSGEFHFVPVQLRDAWSGQVLAGCPGSIRREELALPAVDVWREWLDQLVQERTRLPGYRVLKFARRAEVAAALLPLSSALSASSSIPVVCRFGVQEGWERFAGRLRPPRPRRNFDRALTLLRLGIGTAKPLALIECGRSRESWLVTEFLRDTMDLDQILTVGLPQLPAAAAAARSLKRGLIEAVATLIVSLERGGFGHRDLKASNILIANWNDSERRQATVVDLDGLYRRRWWHKRWQSDIRLAASTLDSPTLTQTDYLRFLRRYGTLTSRAGDDWKSLFRWLARAARCYAERSSRRKSGKLDGYSGA